MTIPHFIEGVKIHRSGGPFERFMKWQRKNNPQATTKDEDLQKAMQMKLNENGMREPNKP